MVYGVLFLLCRHGLRYFRYHSSASDRHFVEMAYLAFIDLKALSLSGKLGRRLVSKRKKYVLYKVVEVSSPPEVSSRSIPKHIFELSLYIIIIITNFDFLTILTFSPESFSEYDPGS
jgi:hypothetical protein